MKQNKNLTKVLYVFVILSLIYTCFTMFTAYNSISSYYGSELSSMDALMYVLSNVFVPLMLTVVLYALAGMNETLGLLLTQKEQVVEIKEEEQPKEIITDEKVEKWVGEVIAEHKPD